MFFNYLDEDIDICMCFVTVILVKNWINHVVFVVRKKAKNKVKLIKNVHS